MINYHASVDKYAFKMSCRRRVDNDSTMISSEMKPWLLFNQRTSKNLWSSLVQSVVLRDLTTILLVSCKIIVCNVAVKGRHVQLQKFWSKNNFAWYLHPCIILHMRKYISFLMHHIFHSSISTPTVNFTHKSHYFYDELVLLKLTKVIS